MRLTFCFSFSTKIKITIYSCAQADWQRNTEIDARTTVCSCQCDRLIPRAGTISCADVVNPGSLRCKLCRQNRRKHLAISPNRRYILHLSLHYFEKKILALAGSETVRASVQPQRRICLFREHENIAKFRTVEISDGLPQRQAQPTVTHCLGH